MRFDNQMTSNDREIRGNRLKITGTLKIFVSDFKDILKSSDAFNLI